MRLQVLVGHRPVHADAVARPELEVSGHHPGGTAHPALRIAAEARARIPLLGGGLVLEHVIGIDAGVLTVGDPPGLGVLVTPFQDEDPGIGTRALEVPQQEERGGKRSTNDYDIVVRAHGTYYSLAHVAPLCCVTHDCRANHADHRYDRGSLSDLRRMRHQRRSWQKSRLLPAAAELMSEKRPQASFSNG